MADSGGQIPTSLSCINTITFSEFVALAISHFGWSWRYAMKKTMCHAGNSKPFLTRESYYRRTHIVPDDDWNQSLAAIPSHTLPAKSTLKWDWDFYLKQTVKILLYFTFIKISHMCYNKLTQSQYAHQKVVETFGDLRMFYNQWGSTHTSRIVSYPTVMEGIEYNIGRYITTGLVPFEGFSKNNHGPKRRWAEPILVEVDRRLSHGKDGV